MKLIISFITYGSLTAKYLPYFLPSLISANKDNHKIIVLDNSDERDNKNSIYIKANYPQINLIWAGKNLGFAKGYNLLIKKAIEKEAQYFLMLNPDMILEENMINEMLIYANKYKFAGAIAPKILHWDFKNKKKTNIIDSYGLCVTKEHRFSDKRQGEIDDNKYEKKVFGFTGAAVLLKIEALKDVAYNKNGHQEYFDELMFMYKEDCDLSYRLQLAGWETVFALEATAYHDREVSPKGESNFKIALNRFKKNRQVKKWAFLNHWIIILKYLRLPFSKKVKIRTYWYQVKSFIFVLFFEQYLLLELWKLRKIRQEIRKKSNHLKIRIKINKIEQIME
ncbi:MAG: glycosyltransferase family 2 protein [Patescibacteria group bacterium]